MPSELSDTDPETQRVHWELLRQAGPSARLRLALSLSRTVIGLSKAGLARRLPNDTPEALGLLFVAMHYGDELAEDVRRCLEARRA